MPDHLANDRPVLLFNPGLVVLVMDARSRKHQPLRFAEGDGPMERRCARCVGPWIRRLSCGDETLPEAAAETAEAVKAALLTVWEAADRICGKRLKAVIPNLLGAMEKYGHLSLEPELRKKLIPIAPQAAQATAQ